MSTYHLLIFLLGILVVVAAAASPSPSASTCSAPNASMSFILSPLDLQNCFSLQSLMKPSRYPYVTADGEIFLTRDPADSAQHTNLYNVGRISYTGPLELRDPNGRVRSFSTFFVFNITTFTKYNESGDGIAFVVTTDSEPPQNSTGRFLGLMPEKASDRHQQFIAVEFDTFQNLEPEILDPSASHIGIDISSLSSAKPYLNTADPSHPLYLYNNYTISAWVSYNSSTHLIQVWATNSTYLQRPRDPILSVSRNLSQLFENFSDIYVGITAASGNNSQATILYSWNFTVGEFQIQHSSPGLPLLWSIVVAAIFAVVLFIAAIFAVPMIVRRRKLALIEQKSILAIRDVSLSVQRYRYSELMRATQKFSEHRKIGKGGFSSVYKGILRDGTILAIKRMREGLAEADVISREVEIISRIKHRNLLELEGWCYERGEALLVYQYMERGSLDRYLHGDKSAADSQELHGEIRYKIITGVAAALEYLHFGLTECVLHRDVKAANVLLTDTMEAKLGDFGLARLINRDEIVTITAVGTPGYVAPEIVHTGRVTEKADVYSFGVLAMEIACGRRAIDPSNMICSRLSDWVWLHHQRGSITEALDPAILHPPSGPPLRGDRDGSELQQLEKWQCVLHLGLLCCQEDPEARPDMSEVHQALKSQTVLPPPSSWALYSIRSSGTTTRSDGTLAPSPESSTISDFTMTASLTYSSQYVR
ncbi:hypothetical protein KP509_02G067100 [Ceratopteris richardii]|uniref:non-specific serine/threonine protein kinase n=1 Tax=Ceratopteris richardii TaxID=49495 RepID=A0A8T2VAA6_CERRI|nr:hypothetical protein KP509_02G067100 [Ceratopteris richardii]